MPVPNLIHPIDVTVQREDKAATIVDADFREPVQKAARATEFTIKGQVRWGSDEKLDPQLGGPREESDGWVLFRYADLRAIGEELKRGDRFTRLGLIDTDVYVVEVKPMGHWQDQSGATIMRAYFRDRQPGRQSRGAL